MMILGMEETITFINRFELTDCLVLISKNAELIYKFISEVKAKKIYINKNPFENYKVNLTEDDLIYKKSIKMG